VEATAATALTIAEVAANPATALRAAKQQTEHVAQRTKTWSAARGHKEVAAALVGFGTTTLVGGTTTVVGGTTSTRTTTITTVVGGTTTVINGKTTVIGGTTSTRTGVTTTVVGGTTSVVGGSTTVVGGCKYRPWSDSLA
jgi:hypothetical protein